MVEKLMVSKHIIILLLVVNQNEQNIVLVLKDRMDIYHLYMIMMILLEYMVAQ